MSKYNKFEDFMTSVVVEANRKSQGRYNKPLSKLYELQSENTYDVCLKLIGAGWYVFMGVATLLVLGPLAFGISLTAFLLTPVGIIVAAILVGGGIAGLRLLYQNKKLPLAIKETGEYYKGYFNNHINETSYLDGLIDSASDYLIKKALSN